MNNSNHCQSKFWDNFFLKRKHKKTDLDWGFKWLKPHIDFLKQNHVKNILIVKELYQKKINER